MSGNGAVNMRSMRMIELAIGTIFRYDGILCKVVEAQSGCCIECAMGYDFCIMLECNYAFRQDGKNVCFKLVEE